LAFATPAAIVPTPTSETSFTEMRASGLMFLQVVDQLLDVLDRVDVVMRRRRDEGHAGSRVADTGDLRVHLVARQLAALAGLAPCATLICNSRQLTQYSAVTPKRPLATCLIALQRLSPFRQRL